MSVASVDSKGRLRRIPASTSDNCLFFGYFLIAFVPIGIQIYLKILTEDDSYSGGPSVLTLYLCLILFFAGLLFCVALFFEFAAAFKLSRASGIRMPMSDEDKFVGLLKEERSRLQITKRSTPEIYWAPTNYRMGAKVFGGFIPKLLITGGLSVAIAKNHRVARFILRHELAHLKNKDTRFYVLILGAVLLPLTVLTFSTPQDLLLAMVNVGVVFFISTFLLRRTEYLADAIATNGSDSRMVYAEFLEANAGSESGWFHPSPNARLKAIRHRSPVLSTSLGLLTLGFALILASWFRVFFLISSSPDSVRYRLGDVSPKTFFFLLTVLPVITIIFELAKGFRRKLPVEWNHETAVQYGSEIVSALCLMDGWWWTINLLLRLLRLLYKMPKPHWQDLLDHQFNEGTIACAIIAIAWMIAGVGLIFYKSWSRYLSLFLASVSILWHIFEFLSKERFMWFGWYEVRYGMDIPAAFAIWILLTLSAFWIIISLFRKGTKRSFVHEGLGRSMVVGFATIAAVIAGVGSTAISAIRMQPQIDAAYAEAHVAPTAPALDKSESVDDPKRLQLSEQTSNTIWLNRSESVNPELPTRKHVVRIIVGKDGTVQDVRLFDRSSSLPARVSESLKSRRYRPYLLNGDPVEFETKIHVAY